MSKKYEIAVIGGDGTGPEVVAEGIKVLEAAADVLDLKFDFADYDFGGERFVSEITSNKAEQYPGSLYQSLFPETGFGNLLDHVI